MQEKSAQDQLVQDQLEAIGARLRLARVAAYLTQSDVGRLAGVSRQLVSRIEQGCNGEISAYFAVAAALNLRFTVAEGTGAEGTGAEGTAANERGLQALDFGSESATVRASGGKGKRAAPVQGEQPAGSR